MATHRSKRGTALLLSLSLFAAATAPAAAPIHLDHNGEKWASATLHKMTLEEKVGQMIMVWARIQFLNTDSPEYLKLREAMSKYHVGGFGVTIATEGATLLKSAPYEAANLTNDLQRDSKLPLIFAADFERGLSVRMNGPTIFPAAMAFGATGDPKLVQEFGRISAEESRAIGIHWNWFPVADINSNPANPIINTRSFGEDPAAVSTMVDAYIAGARDAGLLTTVKHFPGHGDTDTDSHLSLARVTGSLDRLNSVELVPFKAAIAAGVDSVMIGHITVPAIEPDPNLPASISPRIVTGLLKEQLGFKGIVVTDALDMGALMHAFTGTDAEISGKEAVAAVKAGNDMIIIPADLDGTYNGLLAAVKQGVIPEKRIDESVLKILRMKASVGLDRTRFVDLSQLNRILAQPANEAIAQSISDRSITLAIDKRNLLPIPVADSTVAILFTDDGRPTEGTRTFIHELHQRAPSAKVFYVDDANAAYTSSEILAAVTQSAHVIALAESVPTPRRVTHTQANGAASPDSGAAQLLNSIVATAPDKTILAAFGNPYTGSGIPNLETYICTFSNTTSSATSLVKAIYGEIPIHGHLPIAIPNIAPRGAGLDRAATTKPQ